MFGMSLLKWIAVFTFFAGIIGTLFYDIILIVGDPSVESVKRLLVDIGKVFLNSQEEIKVSIEEFKTAETEEYKNFVLWRIAGASVISIGLVVLIYKGLSWIVPGTAADLGTKLILILFSFGLVYAVGLFTSILIGEGPIWPLSGWVELVKQRQVIIEYILERYATGKG